MKAIGNTTQWMKMGNVERMSFMSKDVICFAVGCHAVFINLHSHEEHTFIANSRTGNGDGISVLRGHKSSYLFAYAENCKGAAIYIKSYPNFQLAKKLLGRPQDEYIAMTFRRNILTNRDSCSVRTANARLQLPKTIQHDSIGIGSDNITLWDLHVCCRKIFLGKNIVKVPKSDKIECFVDVLWTTEGGCYILDDKACVYTIDSEYALEMVITLSVLGDHRPSFAWYKGGLAISGPDNSLRHYKKSGAWMIDWILPLEIGINYLMSNKSDYLIGINVELDIVTINNTNGIITHLKPHMSAISDFCLISPVGEYLVAVRKEKILDVFHVETGNFISTYELPRKAVTVTENPEFPYLAIGYENGLVELISAYNHEKLSFMTSFHLSSNAIKKIEFFEEGRILVAGALDVGEIFIIEGTPGTQMKITAHVNTKCQIVDYMLVASKSCNRLFVLPVTSKFLAGNKIIRYCIITAENINIKEYFFESSDSLYHGLVPSKKVNRDRVFYALPFSSRTIHVIETRRGSPLIKITEEIKSGHQMRHFGTRISKRHGLTWGFDGFVMARCDGFAREVGMSLAHHRYLGGVSKAYIDPLGKYILSLGRDDVLVCTNLVDRTINQTFRNTLVELKESTKFALMFKRFTMGFEPEGKFQNMTWMDVDCVMKLESDELECREEKQEILAEFKDIKTTLNKMITNNLEGPENEKIDLLEFYLDTPTYNIEKHKNKEECKKKEVYFKALIEARDRVSQHIIRNYLDKMRVSGRIIRGIFHDVMATNYTMLPVDPAKVMRLAWVEEQRRVEMFLSANDSFRPWLPIKPTIMRRRSSQPIKLTLEDYTSMMSKKILEENLLTHLTVETQIAVLGSVSQLYIERSTVHYRQRELVSFHQCDLQQSITEFEVMKLKDEHNKAFDKLVELKNREMESVKERHARLRHIISEYNYFSENKIDLEIEDPKWTADEEPWMVRTVLDDELDAIPYISPSEQAIIDAKAAEEERIRLALLEDDFKDRALMAMMNGVLEIKWEDELKKDVPMPRCMVK
ncbi:hypothetical protein JTB14_024580 [Gonioctena quinquepunctata]|nr:hypothetical protein JTB14_024580 [Gonioctena quinquepunctata]